MPTTASGDVRYEIAIVSEIKNKTQTNISLDFRAPRPITTTNGRYALRTRVIQRTLYHKKDAERRFDIGAARERAFIYKKFDDNRNVLIVIYSSGSNNNNSISNSSKCT